MDILFDIVLCMANKAALSFKYASVLRGPLSQGAKNKPDTMILCGENIFVFHWLNKTVTVNNCFLGLEKTISPVRAHCHTDWEVNTRLFMYHPSFFSLILLCCCCWQPPKILQLLPALNLSSSRPLITPLTLYLNNKMSAMYEPELKPSSPPTPLPLLSNHTAQQLRKS